MLLYTMSYNMATGTLIKLICWFEQNVHYLSDCRIHASIATHYSKHNANIVLNENKQSIYLIQHFFNMLLHYILVQLMQYFLAKIDKSNFFTMLKNRYIYVPFVESFRNFSGRDGCLHMRIRKVI